jgi:hypothetical protein
MSTEKLWNEDSQEKTEETLRKKTLILCHFVGHESDMNLPGIDPILWIRSLCLKGLSCGTALGK